MAFAVSARHTAASSAAIVRQREVTRRQLLIEERKTSTRRNEFEAFDRLLVDEKRQDELRKSMKGLSRRNKSHDILQAVAELHGVTIADIKGPSRKRKFALARQHAAYEIRRQCHHLSLPMIGRILGGRDHTTILYATRVWPAKAAKLGIPVPGFDPLPRRQA
ncbi:MAG: hypothetical protein EOP20_11210 [Hyphomicrobiales bacterium]|nr:MAG: hypothetical protein EOP20_11210 [Hyphomicrobiales bacterium]